MDKIKEIRVKKSDGSYGAAVPIGADAAYIDTQSGSDLETVLSTVTYKEEIVDNLASERTDKPLSAKQGKILSELIKANEVFKGEVTNIAALPAVNNNISDTYYVREKQCKYSWNGNRWVQSSVNTDDLRGLGGVQVSDEAPTNDAVEVWIDSDTTEELQLLTAEDKLELQNQIDVLNNGGLYIKDSVIQQAIANWMEAHPWASTYVLDGSITKSKIDNELLPYIYITSGTTEKRPLKGVIGQQYFDTTLKKAIWYTGIDWVDALGNPV